jgi:hypothetical protein
MSCGGSTPKRLTASLPLLYWPKQLINPPKFKEFWGLVCKSVVLVDISIPSS